MFITNIIYFTESKTQSSSATTTESDQQLSLTTTQHFAAKLHLPNSDDDESSATSSYDEEEEDEEFEFSFASMNTDGSPIAADAIFHNGQIRPIFDQSLRLDSDTPKTTYSLPPLRKLFVEEPGGSDPLDGVDEETYCVWNGKSLREVTSPENCRKSSSAGFSKRWRFRDMVRRSSSDGKDAFVFLKPSDAGKNAKEGKLVGDSAKVKKVTAAPERNSRKAVQSAHERHYVRNRAVKESDRRKSYLPYRQDLVGVGFFVNVNGMSKNLHPY